MTIGDITVTEADMEPLQSVAPLAGQERAVSAALERQLGIALTKPNRAARNGTARVQWFGHGTWLVRGAVALDGLAAVTDQCDAWASVVITGVGIEDMLARLVPIDLRARPFPVNQTARTLLGHMPCAITRVASDAVAIMVMRSMARTLVHELEAAMRGRVACSNF
ncbi:sarcosine oxidase subunit gamma [Yoonia sp.]|uniref:sarcosine oxidase subunit gamma n=1 Tax=Yoonia sp. TaxID=2212373 RepID=UPI003F6C3A65